MEIAVRNLGMAFRDGDRTIEVFKDLNLELPRAVSLSIVGRSGVGKTTFLHILGGLEQPTSGEALIGGVSLSKLFLEGKDIAQFRGERVGFIFQSHHLLPEFDAVENVAMPLLIRGVSEQEAHGRARDLLTRVGLGERLQHRPGMLSGGEQQRVSIARAIAGRPAVILADEPTGNLDQRTGRAVMALLLELQREEGISLVLVTHSPELAGMTDRSVELTPNGFEEAKFAPDSQPHNSL